MTAVGLLETKQTRMPKAATRRATRNDLCKVVSEMNRVQTTPFYNNSSSSSKDELRNNNSRSYNIYGSSLLYCSSS